MAALTRVRQIEIENIAVELLQDFDIHQFPLSIKEIARALGIRLVPYSSLSRGERELAFAASGDAFHVRNADFSNARIVFDDTHGAYFYRSRFSGAHEIGHIVLGHREDTPNREREADYFAGYLLAPHPLVLKYGPSFGLSEIFGVSGDCAGIAYNQARERKREGGLWRPHEQWLLDNAVWKGGGLLACA